jgi:hypothetical protein
VKLSQFQFLLIKGRVSPELEQFVLELDDNQRFTIFIYQAAQSHRLTAEMERLGMNLAGINALLEEVRIAKGK